MKIQNNIKITQVIIYSTIKLNSFFCSGIINQFRSKFSHIHLRFRSSIKISRKIKKKKKNSVFP
jgi:hypothetical protein